MSDDRIKWTTITDCSGSATLATMRDQLYSTQTSVRARRESTPIYDALVLEQLAASSPRPSLWQRTPEWAKPTLIPLAVLVAVVLLLVLS